MTVRNTTGRERAKARAAAPAPAAASAAAAASPSTPTSRTVRRRTAAFRSSLAGAGSPVGAAETAGAQAAAQSPSPAQPSATPRAGTPGSGAPQSGAARSAPRSAAARSAAAALRLILSAERLYAEHGLDGVSLRQISAAAGHGNNNAVQYHFGSKDGLIQAIIAHRLPAIDRRRTELLAAARAAGTDRDVRVLIDVLMRPLAEEARDPSSHYVRFIGRMSQLPLERNPWWGTGQPASEVAYEVTLLIMEQLTHLPLALRQLRLRHATMFCLTALATQDGAARAAAGDHPADPALELPYEVFVADLFDMATAGLLAPMSETARQLLPPDTTPAS